MNIRGLKIKIVSKIIFLILFIIFTGLYWDRLEIRKYVDYARNNSQGNLIGFNVESDHGYVLNLLDNKDNNDSRFRLNVYNETNSAGHYEIALALNKNCDYKKLYLAIDNNVYNLNELYYDADNDYNYFMVVDSVIETAGADYMLGLYIKDCDVEYFTNNNPELTFMNLIDTRL